MKEASRRNNETISNWRGKDYKWKRFKMKERRLMPVQDAREKEIQELKRSKHNGLIRF